MATTASGGGGGASHAASGGGGAVVSHAIGGGTVVATGSGKAGHPLFGKGTFGNSFGHHAGQNALSRNAYNHANGHTTVKPPVLVQATPPKATSLGGPHKIGPVGSGPSKA